MQCIADDRLTSWRQPCDRSGTGQRPDRVSPLDQRGDQAAADVPGAAGDENREPATGHSDLGFSMPGHGHLGQDGQRCFSGLLASQVEADRSMKPGDLIAGESLGGQPFPARVLGFP